MSDSKFHIEDEPRQYFAEGELLPETSTLLPETPRPSETARLIRTVGLNTLYQIGAQVAPAIAAIAAIPILLRYLGAEPYGIVTLFSTALIYFTMLDLGLGRAQLGSSPKASRHSNRRTSGAISGVPSFCSPRLESSSACASSWQFHPWSPTI